MNSVLLWICNLFNAVLNYGILVLAVFEFVLAIRCSTHLHTNQKEIKNLTGESSERHQTAWKSGKRKVTTTRVITYERDWGEYDGFRKKYQKSLSKYNKFTLYIQLFPLLGILGTVAGLYIAMNARDGAASLYSGVGFALSSTILGIVFAIIFKIWDVILSNTVNVIDDNIDRYEKNYTVETREAQGSALDAATPLTTADNTTTRREQ